MATPAGQHTLAPPEGRRRLRLNLTVLRQGGPARALLPAALFECGHVAVTLLILRGTDLLHTGGRSLAAATSLTILIYAGHNAVAAVTSLAGRALIDRIGPRPVFAAGASLYLAAYAGFAAGWPS